MSLHCRTCFSQLFCRNFRSRSHTHYLILSCNPIHVRNLSRKTQSHPEQCMEMVKKFDYENFLSSLLLPSQARSAAFAIRAFNIELAQVRDIVSDKNLGLMRIQFWKDSIEKIYQKNPPHTPIAYELARVIHKHGLNKMWFSRLIDAREQNMSDNPFPSLPKVEEYAEKSVSSIHYLLLQSLGVQDVNADHAASHVGKAVGISTLLRGVPFNAQRQRCYLPVDLMIMHNVSQEDIFRGQINQGIKDLAYDIASQAHIHLEHARAMKNDIPKTAIPALYCTAAIETYLKVLQRADFDLFDGRLQQRNHWLPLQLWLNKFRKRY